MTETTKPTRRRITGRNVGYTAALVSGVAVFASGTATSFDNLAHYAHKHGWIWGPALPLGLDLGIFALLLLDWLRPSVFLRSAAWTLTAGTVAANFAVTDGDATDRSLHAVVILVAVIIFEAARHLRDDPSRMDKIRLSRWLLSPVRTGRLWRRMVLWEVTSYAEALRRESAILDARTVLTARYRKRSWRRARRVVPLTLRHQLTTGQLPASVLHSLDLQSAVTGWVESSLEALVDRRQHVICSGPSGTVFLRRPKPRRTSEPAGPVGSRVVDIEEVLNGVHGAIVYFVRNGNRVKIGTTTNMRSRISALCLRVADIALVLHGGQDYERHLHSEFADYRVSSSEWFMLTGDLAAFVASGGQHPEPTPTTSPDRAPGGGGSDDAATGSGASERQPESASDADPDSGDDAPTVEDSDTESAPVSRPNGARSGGRSSRKRTRRSMTQWVNLTSPIFRAEFARLQRQPTGEEFAEAIRKARLGTVSASTAKKIRTEILDRLTLPVVTPVVADQVDAPAIPAGEQHVEAGES